MHPVGFRDPFDSTRLPPSVIAVIPARHDATRLPGKPLIQIAGRPMIEHVYRRAAAAPGVEAVVVATDDPRIANVKATIAHRHADGTGDDLDIDLARFSDAEVMQQTFGRRINRVRHAGRSPVS